MSENRRGVGLLTLYELQSALYDIVRQSASPWTASCNFRRTVVPLVFADKFRPEILMGSVWAGCQARLGWGEQII